MLKKQKPYDFKKELLQVHKKDIRDKSLKKENDEFEIKNGICIVLPKEENIVVYTAAKDFVDYLLVSMGVGAYISKEKNDSKECITLEFSKDLDSANGFMGHSVTVSENEIKIEGFDDVGIAQGLYLLEDLMNIRKAPFIKYGNMKRKSIFDMRLTQSPFGMFEYPDEALSLMAHRGYTTVDVWIKDAYTTLRGDYIDLKLLSDRCEKYGLKINIELYKVHEKYPDDEGAQEYYDALYGEIFEACPNIASLILIGEANHFVSRDPDACIKYAVDNIPTGKFPTGWWPCNDYPKFVGAIKKAVEKYNKDTKIIFCTYNWGFVDKEYREKLIENLPEGITILAGWEMFKPFKRGNVVENVTDYTMLSPQPGDYFISEAKVAMKKGLKMATLANSSGRTWDFGTIPFEPFADRWIEKFKALVSAHDNLNLTGLVENIHYAFQPSIINDLEKWALFTPLKPIEEVYDDLLARDFEDNAKYAKEAMSLFSEAVGHYSITDEDQYGAFRIGPTYPLWLSEYNAKMPVRRKSMFGNGVYFSEYKPQILGRSSMPGVRIFNEIENLCKMIELLQKGIDILENCKNSNQSVLLLLNLAKFIKNSTVTALNVKKLFVLRNKLNVSGTRENTEGLIDEIEKLLLEEKANVENTIPLVQVDSRIGWEPSMEYQTDEYSLRWKLRQLDYELSHSIPKYRKSNSLIDMF